MFLWAIVRLLVVWYEPEASDTNISPTLDTIIVPNYACNIMKWWCKRT